MKKGPLAEALNRYIDSCAVRCHVPGHKGRRPRYGNDLWAANPWLYDATELPGLDDLAAPDGVIMELENRLAALYGARKSFLSVQGSTLGLQASVLALCSDGDTVVVPRNAHRSVISGLVLSGAMPYYIQPDIEPHTGIAMGPSPEAYEAALSKAQNVKAVLVNNPNYYGICPDLVRILAICKEAGVRCIVDEAHGAHLRFMPDGPPNGVALGADIVIQSPHKTLFSLTQAAWVHVCTDNGIAERVKQCLVLLQTSSPSYLLLVSLEDSIVALETGGRELLRDIREMTAKVVQEALRLGYSCPITQYPNDGLRCYIVGSDGRLNGKDLYQNFIDLGVFPELHDALGVLLVMGLGSNRDDYSRLMSSLEKIATAGAYSSFALTGRNGISIAWKAREGYSAVSPRNAVFGKTEQVKLSDAEGRIAAELVAPSPPSIALLAPGDIIDRDSVRLLRSLIDTGSVLHGLTDVTLNTIKVIV